MTLENKWHELPCGAQVRILNGKALAVTVTTMISSTREYPPSDEVVLKQIGELIGYPVILTSGWVVGPEGVVKAATLKEKLVLDDPEQL